MLKAKELYTLDDVVKDSERLVYKEDEREFNYRLNEKSLKTKLLKGAKRPPFVVVKNNGSYNLDFNVGSWRAVVQPSLQYWGNSKVGQTCTVNGIEIKLDEVKNGSEAGGLHVDTLITFLVNKEKAKCHFYNTTQRVMINGLGHAKLSDIFLVPYFESKISLNDK